MARIPATSLLALAACGRIAFDVSEGGAPDACTTQTFHVDLDGDGHGDGNAPLDAPDRS